MWGKFFQTKDLDAIQKSFLTFFLDKVHNTVQVREDETTANSYLLRIEWFRRVSTGSKCYLFSNVVLIKDHLQMNASFIFKL